jgi:hypothetical protein
MIPPKGVGGGQELAESSSPDFNRYVASSLHAARSVGAACETGVGTQSLAGNFGANKLQRQVAINIPEKKKLAILPRP